MNPLLLRFASGQAERTHREALAGGSGQAAINERLIDEARAGKTVVRLKGGDPYIFGRGSEEAAALAAAEVEFEVVPGVTAAVAAGEYAGLSFTHRQYASAVAFITGHEIRLKGSRHWTTRPLPGSRGRSSFTWGCSVSRVWQTRRFGPECLATRRPA